MHPVIFFHLHKSNMSTYQIKFGEPKQITTKGGQKFYTIPIDKEQDGVKDKLTFLTDKCFSWGLQKNEMVEKQGKSEYKLPICLINKDENGTLQKTERETKFFELWDTLVKMAKQFCLENKALIGRYDMEEAHLRKIGCCLYVKKVDGKAVEGYAPFLYPKVKTNSKTGKVYTIFHKAVIKRGQDSSLDLKDIEGKRCELRANIHFESIFVNSQHVTIQVKVLEAAIWPPKEEKRVIPVEVEDEEEF